MAEKDEGINRRAFLKETGRTVAAALAAGGITALARQRPYADDADDFDRYDFLMPRVRFYANEGDKDYWANRPEGDMNLLRRLASVVRCKVKLGSGAGRARSRTGLEGQFNAVVDFGDIERLRKFPFLFMMSQHHYSVHWRDKLNLKEYLLEGGFLLMDDCVVGSRADYFYQSSYALLEDIFGSGVVKRVTNDHEVFHNVYDLGDIGLPRVQGANHGARGVFIGDRLAVFLSCTDIHCAWAGVVKRYRQEAFQMGVNVIMYALTH
ncbi:MAG: DUF4159 domain-containing protein [Planctomycetota bacterium]|jgi:hypothetical protein